MVTHKAVLALLLHHICGGLRHEWKLSHPHRLDNQDPVYAATRGTISVWQHPLQHTQHRLPSNSATHDVQAIRVLRVLCREEFGIASAKTFVEDLKRSMEWLTSHYIYTPEQVQSPDD